MTPSRTALLSLVAAVLTCQAVPATAQRSAIQPLRTIETRYYILHTDLDDDHVREAVQRITLMAEEYHRRTSGLGRTVTQRLPFYLFSDFRAYEANGGLPGSAGVFTGDRLMAVVMPQNPAFTWYVVQHEGFHQFVYAAIGPNIPIWANEGLAEYFAQGIFTGHRFLLGAVPPERLARVKLAIREQKYLPLAEMMRLPQVAWNIDLRSYHYDQAWAMVHFLAHGDNGRYQDAFFDYLRDVSRGVAAERAWTSRMGTDIRAFQQRWEAYWTSLPDYPTEELYAEAATEVLTAFLARAFSQRQYFEEFEPFATAILSGEIQMHAQDWLPATLAQRVLEDRARFGTWALVRRPGQRLLTLTRPDGTVYEGSYRVERGQVRRVEIKVRPPARRR
ncbi:MAG: DUF1570 domain-containing protein [Phycisphaerales bacterium]|nr:DUF1570 domain-containing protein [Phycisphaerales bacterium]